VLRGRERDIGFEPVTSGGVRIAVIVAPSGNRGVAANRQGYARHPAGLDHRSCSPIHWAADTHGDKSEGIPPKPGRPQRTFFQLSRHRCLFAAPATHVLRFPRTLRFGLSKDVQRKVTSQITEDAFSALCSASGHPGSASAFHNWLRSVTFVPTLG
jgi:hypothetical protein